jgi:transcriptional regulator with XRE-family HTH domain
MSKISTNIRHLRSLKNLTQDELSVQLDINRSRLGAYEEGRSEPPIEMLIRISDHFHIAIDALVKGDLRKTDPSALMKIGKNRILFPVLIDKENNEQIEVVTVKASAGYLTGYGDPEYMEKMPLMKLPFHVTGKHRAFCIKGDSMLPVKPGSYVIGKYIEGIKDIRDGNTYIMLTKEDGIVYKRIFVKGNELELHSDNKEYQPYKVKTDEILEVWEFVCYLHLSDKKEEEVNMDSVMKMLRSLQVEMERIKK